MSKKAEAEHEKKFEEWGEEETFRRLRSRELQYPATEYASNWLAKLRKGAEIDNDKVGRKTLNWTRFGAIAALVAALASVAALLK